MKITELLEARARQYRIASKERNELRSAASAIRSIIALLGTSERSAVLTQLNCAWARGQHLLWKYPGVKEANVVALPAPSKPSAEVFSLAEAAQNARSQSDQSSEPSSDVPKEC